MNLKFLYVIFSLCAVIAISFLNCSDDEENASFENVWKMSKESISEGGLRIYPIESGTRQDYVKFTANAWYRYKKYQGTNHDGVFWCSNTCYSGIGSYTISGTTIIGDSLTGEENETSSYSISGNNLKITDQDGEYYEFTLAGELDIAGAVEYCDYF